MICLQIALLHSFYHFKSLKIVILMEINRIWIELFLYIPCAVRARSEWGKKVLIKLAVRCAEKKECNK